MNSSTPCEFSLSQGQTFIKETVASGTDYIVVSISWTDPFGRVNQRVANDITPVLVNYLDVCELKKAQTHIISTVLHRLQQMKRWQYSRSFWKNNSFRPNSGKFLYDLHMGTLTTQNFSLIISGIEENISTNSFIAVSNSSTQIDLSWSKIVKTMMLW